MAKPTHGETLPGIETCRIKLDRSAGKMSEEELHEFRNQVEERYGTRNFNEAQRRIFVINQWKTERKSDNERTDY